MTSISIRGIKFKIDENGFVSSPLGEIGHTETCEEFAELMQNLFEISDKIKNSK